MKNIKCPKCGVKTKGNFCINCGFDLRNLKETSNSNVINKGIFKKIIKKKRNIIIVSGIIFGILTFFTYGMTLANVFSFNDFSTNLFSTILSFLSVFLYFIITIYINRKKYAKCGKNSSMLLLNSIIYIPYVVTLTVLILMINYGDLFIEDNNYYPTYELTPKEKVQEYYKSRYDAICDYDKCIYYTSMYGVNSEFTFDFTNHKMIKKTYFEGETVEEYDYNNETVYYKFVSYIGWKSTTVIEGKYKDGFLKYDCTTDLNGECEYFEENFPLSLRKDFKSLCNELGISANDLS